MDPYVALGPWPPRFKLGIGKTDETCVDLRLDHDKIHTRTSYGIQLRDSL